MKVVIKMASQKTKKDDIKDEKIKNNEKEQIKNLDNNSFFIKFLTFIGVVVLCIIIILIMKHFFVDKNNIGINYSTDKKLEYIALEGDKELISTQKYVSELGYNMRYDVERFKVFKYKNQDIYKFIENEQVLVLVEKSTLPSDCNADPLENGYNNCYKYIDDTMDEYYISSNNKTYRILVKTPGGTEYAEGVKVRIQYMINTFEITE